VQLRPPSGFRDFSPREMILRKKILGIIEDCFIRYGFDPIETPAIEYWETFEGKYGEEAENKLLYRFKDPWSEKWFALRFDLTVPMVRFFASKALPIPFKRYHIGRVWRHERPQRGRYREFWQADADIIGSVFPEADAELLDLTIYVLQKLGFRNFVVKLNDRKMLRGIFEEELELRDVLPIYRAIDKLDKIGLDGVREELKKLGLDSTKVERIIDIISEERSPDLMLETIQNRFRHNENVKQGVSHLSSIIDFLDNKKKYVQIALNLVRGLDYYTGPVWEVVLTDIRIGSIAGGGRYDDLIFLYTGKNVPATGTSLGVERVIEAGIELGLFNLNTETYTTIYVVSLSKNAFKHAWKLAMKLRDTGFSTQVDLMRRSEKKQREYVSKKDIPLIIFLGEKEIKSGIVTIYDRRTGKRYTVKEDAISDTLKKIL